MFRAIVACLVLSSTPALARVIDKSKAVKAYNLAGRIMTCLGSDIVVDNTLPSPGEGTTGGKETSNPANGTVLLNIKKLKRYSPPTQWFVFSHECGHLYGRKVTESRADRYGVWKGVTEGWLKKEHLEDICQSFDPYSPAGNGYPSGRQRCKDLKGYFADFEAFKQQVQKE